MILGLNMRKPVFEVCWPRPACASGQSDQHLFFLENISKLAFKEIPVFNQSFEAEQAGLGMTLLKTPMTVFLAPRPISAQVCV